ncbi:hypothetical protein [Desulfatiglans anilini]|uniref:hypothetical protein n=1 Tax=Desulfatiglans anilini TaxID=90728 RepID=UPI0012948653|nr:hypothetical protein [Desulfatiglans anilini]
MAHDILLVLTGSIAWPQPENSLRPVLMLSPYKAFAPGVNPFLALDRSTGRSSVDEAGWNAPVLNQPSKNRRPAPPEADPPRPHPEAERRPPASRPGRPDRAAESRPCVRMAGREKIAGA